jgi:hypothetical protein
MQLGHVVAAGLFHTPAVPVAAIETVRPLGGTADAVDLKSAASNGVPVRVWEGLLKEFRQVARGSDRANSLPAAR